MKKYLLLFFGLILTSTCIAQITFDKGYYIDNSDNKVECLIKNMDWRNNPISIEYKLSEGSESFKVDINSVKEYGIYNISKYIRRTVKIDKTSGNYSNLSYNKNPKFNDEQLFLRVLIEGESNLYEYMGDFGLRYFYNFKNSKIEQLVYKSYKTADNRIGKNNLFRQQLWKDLKCSTIKLDKVESLEYNRHSLINFFIRYNECSNSNSINYNYKQNKDLFNLTLRPRIRSSFFSFENSADTYKNTNFGRDIGFGFGVEAEFILPFNKNKWGIIFEPTFQNFKSEKTTEVGFSISGGKLISEINYNYVEIPLGVRHYFFVNNNSKIFINISYVLSFSTNSKVQLKRDDNSSLTSTEIQSPLNNLAFGIGYKLNDKFGLEINYQTSRDIFENDAFWSSEYNSMSIIFGYSLF